MSSRRMPMNGMIRRVKISGGVVINKMVGMNSRRGTNISEPTEIKPTDYTKLKEPEVQQKGKLVKKGDVPLSEPIKPKLSYPETASKATRSQVLKAIHKALSEDDPKEKPKRQSGGMIRQLI